MQIENESGNFLTKNDIFVKKFFCFKCNKIFFIIHSLQQHIKFIHQRVNVFKCPYKNCEKIFKNKLRLKVHINSHLGIKNFKCEICEKKFAEKGTLITHYITHSKNFDKKCDLCNYKCTTDTLLKFHYKKRHNLNEIFQCEICKSKFAKKVELRHHIKGHTFKNNLLFKKSSSVNFLDKNSVFDYKNIKLVKEISFGIFIYNI